MKIVIKNVKEHEGLLLEDTLDPQELDMDIGVMQFPEPIQLKAEVWKEADDLTVRAHVEGERIFTCSLCLDEFNNVFEKEITLHYDIKGLDSVLIDPEVREEILLDHPIKVLCKEDCRGLCQSCGANLNHESCDCAKNQ